MDKEKILTQKEVIEKGFHFDGDNVCYGGDYGQQVCSISENGIEIPVTGIIYELNKKYKLELLLLLYPRDIKWSICLLL